MRRVGQYGLVLLITLAVMAWGTSPCLYTKLVSKMANGGAGCCCDCCCEDVPTSGTDDCPACSKNGNMHELPPVGDPVTLDPPTVEIAPGGAEGQAVDLDPIGQIDVDAGRARPVVAFRETVSLQR